MMLRRTLAATALLLTLSANAMPRDGELPWTRSIVRIVKYLKHFLSGSNSSDLSQPHP